MTELWGELRPFLRFLAGISLVMNLLFLLPAIFTMQVFDRVLPSNSQETLLVLLAGCITALLMLLALDYLRGRLQNVLGAIAEERLAPVVLRDVVALQARTPNLPGTEAVRDIAALRAVFSTNALIALFDAPWVLVYVAVIGLFHPALGLGAALAALLMLALAALNDRLSKGALEKLQAEGRRVSRYVENSLRNAEVLQVMGMTDNLLNRWRDEQARLADLEQHASRGGNAFSALTRSFRQLIQIVMLSLGAYLVLSQQASAGIMIATTILLGRAVQPVEQLVGSWKALIGGRAAHRRLRELLKDTRPSLPRVELPRPEGALVAHALGYRAPGSERPILVNVGFQLQPGEALAVIGASAAGKSTLARLLTGVWPATQGSVRLDGVDVASWDRRDLGRWIGYLPQDVELFEGSVADNIARLGRIDSSAVVSAAQRAHVHELILSLPQGYETPIGINGGGLSPGQRQRIGLARALFGDPRLVILDEPNSNLDAAGEAALVQALRGLRQAGVTSVVITHRPSLIAHVDKILVLEAGRVRQFGPASEVIAPLQRPSPEGLDAQVA